MASVVSSKVEALGKRVVHFGDEMDFIPARIRQLLETDWVNADVRDCFLAKSEICRILRKNPADWEMLDIVYYGASPRDGVSLSRADHWLSGSLSGQALRDRLKVVSSWTARYITKALEVDGRLTVLDLGAGPAPYALEALKAIPDCSERLSWRCVDLDQLSLDEGEKRAREHGFERVLEFKNMDFLSSRNAPEADDPRADFGLLVGILCGMSPAEAVSCLQKIKMFFRPGAELIVPTLLNQAFEEDPQTFRVLCNVLGWQLKPKSLDEVREVFVTAGYIVNDIFSEREGGNGQYAIVHAAIPQP